MDWFEIVGSYLYFFSVRALSFFGGLALSGRLTEESDCATMLPLTSCLGTRQFRLTTGALFS